LEIFLNNSDNIWETDDYEIKKGVQGLIIPNGFVLRNKDIEPLKTPDFISIFDIKSETNLLKWS
jgi:hypothetical protein